MADDGGSYEVGYRKPPKATRFVKGQSGNRKGRPKGSKDLDTIVNKIGRQRVRVNGNGGSHLISKLEATVTQLINKAASGDLRAIREVLSLHHKLCAGNEPVAVPEPVVHDRDKIVMESIVRRIRQAQEANPDVSLDTSQIGVSEERK